MTEYKIMQSMRSVLKGWQEIVFSGPIERIAISQFNRLKTDYPDEHFELIKIEHTETCMDWSGSQRQGQPPRSCGRLERIII